MLSAMLPHISALTLILITLNVFVFISYTIIYIPYQSNAEFTKFVIAVLFHYIPKQIMNI